MAKRTRKNKSSSNTTDKESTVATTTETTEEPVKMVEVTTLVDAIEGTVTTIADTEEESVTTDDATGVSTNVEETTPTVEPVEVTSFLGYMQNKLESGTDLEKYIITELNRYLEEMKPRKPVSPQVGIRHQVAFYRAILNVANNEDFNKFNLAWNILLAYFYEYRDGVFNDRYLYRFMDQWPERTVKDMKSFNYLCNLLQITADPNTRKLAMKQVDIAKAIENLPNDAQRNIGQFYSKYQ